MNLDEFRQQMESDATKENEQLKLKIDVLREQLRDSKNDCKELRQSMTDDCLSLANRCWALTHGTMCCFCRLSTFRCPHAWSDDSIVKAVRAAKKYEGGDK